MDFKFDSSLFSGGNKSKKNSLFRPEIFVNDKKEKMDEIERKNLRSQIRKNILKVLHSFVENGCKMNEKQIDMFVKYYFACYLVNDFSVASIYDGNDNEKKSALEKFLSYVKKEHEKQNKK